MNGYFLNVILSGVNHAGPKAKRDVSTILYNDGMGEIYVDSEQSKWEKRLFFSHDLKYKLSQANDSDIFLAQYPFQMGRYASYQIIKQITSKYQNNIILIHDIESLRNQSDKTTVAKEIGKFNHFKFVISHNDKMKQWLKENGCTSEIVSLGLFDYLGPKLESKKTGNYQRVFFAGNLEKSGFLYNDSVSSNYEVYGVGLQNKKHQFNYRGVETPENLTKVLGKENGFGIVWEGNSTEHSSNYIKYNDPHKASLYLFCKMPLVVWSQSALADLVKNERLGLVVDNLEQASDLINNLSEEEYKEYQINTEKYGDRVRNGYFLNHALDEIKKSIKK